MKEKEKKQRTGLEIAVIGMSGRFPGAENLEVFWENLKNGTESMTFLEDEQLKAAGYSPQTIQNPGFVKSAGGVLENREYFDAAFFGYSPTEAQVMNPQVRLLHQCVWEALEDAAYNPDTYEGVIGLYAGASSSFQWEGLTLLSGKHETLGDFESFLLADRDFLTTRISYKLNLKGPAITLETACSTSLVAVDLACRGLLMAQCDMALAGGITVHLPGKSGYYYREGMINSPDGHCRAFDAQAGGTVGGEGMGIVVLKSLEDALQEGDYIYAVILGTAVNNDGGRKVGYTAPSIKGQAEVIRAALHMAEVEPQDIGYIEAHGTGTRLGDTVEIEALNQAFESHRKGFCKISAVKTNIGHLDNAAGIAGFIKAILALKHRLIPPSLHFHTPNPDMNLKGTPFQINRELSPWENDDYPRRAGISAFGIGGTNAHIILEEAPVNHRDKEGTRGLAPLINAEISTEYQLILLSAKTQSSLEQMTLNLANHFRKNPGINLADAAFSLQVGRKKLPYRKFTVCREVEEVVRILESPGSRLAPSFFAEKSDERGEENRSVVFMFPGLGSQYVNMGLDIYNEEPVFRREMDRCFRGLRIRGIDLKRVLYPLEQERWEAEQRINRFDIAQLAVFAFEYALANLLISWGISPTAMIGYSFGEYIAACTAGVFSLDAALELVVLRGWLIRRLPSGAMLSVPLPVKDILPLKDQQLDIAIDNGASSIVSGPAENLDSFEKQMKRKGYLCMPIPTSHALHSPQMEPVLQEFKETISGMTLNLPRLPYISNVTGTWITASEAMDGGYWARHLRQTVRFAQGMNLIFSKKNQLLIEVGPGSDLCSLTSRWLENDKESKALNLVRQPQKKINDFYYLLTRIGRLWLYGVNPDWTRLYENRQMHRVPLPTYPFEGRAYPAGSVRFENAAALMSPSDHLVKKPDAADWFYIPSWTRSMLPSPGAESSPTGSRWVVFTDVYGLGARMIRELEKRNRHVVLVDRGIQFQEVSTNPLTYTLNPEKPEDFNTLFRILGKQDIKQEVILYLWGITGSNPHPPMENIDQASFNSTYSAAVSGILHLAGAVGRHCTHHSRINVISDGMQDVLGNEVLNPIKAAMLGVVRVFPQEFPNIRCKSIDVILPESGSPQEKNLVKQLLEESVSQPEESITAYRENYRWVLSYRPLRMEKKEKSLPLLRKKGVYLITGGMGNIGFTLARFLVKELKARVILTGRNSIPPNPGEDPRVRELVALGGEVLAIKADVSHLQQMEEVIARIEERFGSINGVIHTAGVVGKHRAAAETTWEDFQLHFRSKVVGSLVLEKLLKEKSPDFCLLASSLAPILGGLGFLPYAAANAVMDAIVHRHNRSHPAPWTSINWGDWLFETGETPGEHLNEEELGISPEEGIKTFLYILNQLAFNPCLHQVVVSSGDLDVRTQRWVKLDTVAATEIGSPLDSPMTLPPPNVVSEMESPKNPLEHKMVEIWNSLFGFEQIGVTDSFFELGGDSLKAIHLVSLIHKKLGVVVSLPDFFNRATIRELANYIKEADRKQYQDCKPVEKKEYYPLSYAQRRLWVLCQFEHGSSAYNIPGAFVVSGDFNPSAFERALQSVVKRHQGLRTVFITPEEEPMQKILEDFTAPITREDFRDFDPEQREEKTRVFFLSCAHKTFDLEKGPLFDFNLLQTEDREYLFVFNVHHIIADGWSIDILNREISALYHYHCQGNVYPLQPLLFQYKDYSKWSNKEITRDVSSHNYWMNKFQDKPNGIQLPLDYTRPAVQTFNGRQVHFTIDKAETRGLGQICRSSGATMFMGLLSLIHVLLNRYTGQKDIIIGSPIAARRQPEFQHLVGFLVNTLVFRLEVSAGDNWIDLLRKVKEETLASFENQDYPFDLLVDNLGLDRDVTQSPLFNVMVADEKAGTHQHDRFEQESINMTPYPYANEINMSKFDLTFMIVENELEGNIGLSIEYNSDLFKESSIRRFGSNLITLARSVPKDPSSSIAHLCLIEASEYKTVLEDFNQTDCTFPEAMIQELLENRVRKSPDKIALVDGDTHVSYQYLNREANQLANHLRKEHQVQRNSVIGVFIDRSPRMVTGILGIIKSGAGYVAIDPNYPADRIAHMLSDSGSDLLVVDNIEHPLFDNFSGEIIHIHLDWDTISRQPDDNPTMINQPSDGLYVIYTSGTTGTPNGAILSHRNLTNLVYWHQEKTTIDSSMRCLQFTSITFCVSFQEIAATLCSGGKIHLIGDIERQDIDYLAGFLSRHRIQLLYLPFSYLNFLFNQTSRWGSSFKHSLKHIITAGEQLKITTGLQRFLQQNPGVRLHNHYGSSETHVVTSFSLDAADASQYPIPPAGKPIANTRIYILDEHRHPVPLGVYGELFIGPASPLPGYINNPELTAQKLLNASFKGSRDEEFPLYCTGDIGRWMEDGNIQLRGRKDEQVKIRGFRVEPGEIESKLLALYGVKDCVVVVRNDNSGQKILLAYTVTDSHQLTGNKIKIQIAEKLPQYMIPEIVLIERLPLMPNGKVDRDRLPELEIQPEITYTAPRNEIEQLLVEMWSDLLELDKEKIGIDANFFDCGGHSLKAMILTSAIRKKFPIQFPLHQLFSHPTIREISEYIRNADYEFHPFQYEEIPVAPKADYYPQSAAQRRLFFLDRLQETGIAYNLTAAFLVKGKPDRQRFQNTLQALINRHEGLRTSFKLIDGEPVQILHHKDSINFKLEPIQLISQAAKENKLSPAMIKDVVEMFTRPFSLSNAPLVRAALVKLDEGEFLFIFDMHHIISDAASIRILVDEFTRLYKGENLPPLKLQYKDFSLWQHYISSSGKLKAQESYWKDVYADSFELKPLNLPLDFPRPRIKSFNGDRYTFFLEKDVKETFIRQGKKYGPTLFMQLLAVLNVLLYKYTGQDDIIVLSSVIGRSHTDLQDIVGMFINTLPLRSQPDNQQSFAQFLEAVIAACRNAYENQDVSFDVLIDKLSIPRDLSRNPLSEISLEVQSMEPTPSQLQELDFQPYPLKHDDPDQNNTTSKFDITLFALETNAGIRFDLEYATRLFKKETMETFAQRYIHVIKQVAGSNFDVLLKDIRLLSDEEKNEILYLINDTENQYPREKTLQLLFEEQAARTPDHIAITGENTTGHGESWDSRTYQELNRSANQLAYRLKERGAGPDIIAVVMADPSPHLVIAIMGIIKSGAVYIPIEFQMPPGRKKYILQDSGASIICIRRRLQDENEAVFSTCTSFEGIIIDDSDTASLLATNHSLSNPPAVSCPGDPCYILYTSGTTGTPRGVIVENRGVVNYLWWAVKIYTENEPVNFPLFTSISFDLTVTSLFTPLITGNTLVIYGAAPPETLMDKLIVDRRIQAIKLTPGHLKLISDLGGKFHPGIRRLVLGGEQLETRLASDIHYAHPLGVIYNEYGPTETTVGCMLYRFQPQKDCGYSVPIGKPADNTRIYILDSSQNPVPVGTVGELYISGDGLARGYLNRPESTQAVFMENPFIPGNKMYKTGDLARWLPRGEIEFLGRFDQQLKIRGFRVEPGEIEVKLCSHPQVKDAVVIPEYDHKGMPALFGFIVSNQDITQQELKVYLADFLPHYMIPPYIKRIEKIPLNSNGKLDRKALLANSTSLDSGIRYIQPRTDTEKIVYKIWAEVLGRDKIGTHDNFFDMGGNSMSILQLIAQLKQILDQDIPITALYKYPTISTFSLYLEKGEAGAGDEDYPQDSRFTPGTIDTTRRKKLKMQQKSKRTTGNLFKQEL